MKKGLGQFQAEISWLSSKIVGARAILEIGSLRGESLLDLAKAVRYGGYIYSIDMEDGPWGDKDTTSALKVVLASLDKKGFHTSLYSCSSRDPRPKRQIPGGLDLLFIDGDHTYEGVKHDYLAYGSKVRQGGIIAFHDIASRHGIGVADFWNQIKEDFDHESYLVNPTNKGIGILYVS